MTPSTTPAASAEDIAKHGWTAVPVDANAILKGRPYVHKPRPRLVSDMPFPSDDPVVARIQAYAKEHLILQTYHHSMRVYYWGYAILQDQFPEHADQVSLSTWALACLLHDIGTTSANLQGTLLSFEWFGAILALRLLTPGTPAAQAEAVAEAIIRHQDLGTVGRITLLGQVLQLATVYDNLGANPGLIDAGTTLPDVNRAWPRAGWSGCFPATVREEIGLKPWAHTTHLGEEAFPEGVESNALMRPFDGWRL